MKYDYRNQIEIQQKNITRDTDGAEIEAWTTLHTTFCSMRQLTANEKMAAQQKYAEAKYMLEMWYIDGITEVMRIKKDDGTYLDICGVDNVGSMSELLRLTCKEGAVDG